VEFLWHRILLHGQLQLVCSQFDDLSQQADLTDETDESHPSNEAYSARSHIIALSDALFTIPEGFR
jgi:hypothetical protein